MTKISVRAARALAAAYKRHNPDKPLDPKGYAETAKANLLPGVKFEHIQKDFEQGDGNELEEKFRAAHSSSALVANCFGPFKTRAEKLKVAGASGFTRLNFEHKCPTGLRGTSPNLDLVAEAVHHILAIESKCTEYLTPHEAKFANAYREKISDARRSSPWFREMERLKQDQQHYTYLDAAQLIKHAYGLAHTFPSRAVTLLYLFWEPANPEADPAFAAHRTEIKAFARRVKGGLPSFASLSYAELWETWRQQTDPEWLQQHVVNLEARYSEKI